MDFYVKNKPIVLGVAMVVVLAGVWYLSSNSSGWSAGGLPSTTTTSPTVTKTPVSGTKKSSGTVQKPITAAKVVGVNSLAYLFSLKQPLVCTIKPSATVNRSGTMYVSGGKMRANFVYASMISDGNYLYAWTNGESTGLKLLAAISVSGSAIAAKGGFDPANELSFACNPWAEDASVFTPPTSVTFSNTQ